MVDKVNLAEMLAAVDEPWSPKIVADPDGHDIAFGQPLGSSAAVSSST